jgi:hypothetical protein
MKASLILLLTLLSLPALANEGNDFSIPPEQANGVERGKLSYDDLTGKILTTGVKAELHRVLRSMNRLSSDSVAHVVNAELRSVSGGDMGSMERIYRVLIEVTSAKHEQETLEMIVQEFSLSNPPLEKVVVLSVRTIHKRE